MVVAPKSRPLVTDHSLSGATDRALLLYAYLGHAAAVAAFLPDSVATRSRAKVPDPFQRGTDALCAWDCCFGRSICWRRA